jgi:hypothetical protein
LVILLSAMLTIVLSSIVMNVPKIVQIMTRHL